VLPHGRHLPTFFYTKTKITKISKGIYMRSAENGVNLKSNASVQKYTARMLFWSVFDAILIFSGFKINLDK